MNVSSSPAFAWHCDALRAVGPQCMVYKRLSARVKEYQWHLLPIWEADAISLIGYA